MEALFEKYDPIFDREVDYIYEGLASLKNMEFEILFEANIPPQPIPPNQPNQMNQMNQQNTVQGQKQGVTDHLTNLIKTIGEIITGLISQVSNWFKQTFGGNKEQIYRQQLAEAMRNNPALANKQVTVVDYRQASNQYNNLVNQYENAERSGNEQEAKNALQQLEGGFTGMLRGATVTVGLQAALNIAHSNREMAGMIARQLQGDSKWLKEIERSVGAKKAQAFKKEVETYTKKCTLRRAILKIRGKMFANVSDSVDDVYEAIAQAADFHTTKVNSVGGFFNKAKKGLGLLRNKTVTDIGGNVMQNKDIRDTVGMAMNMPKELAKINNRDAKARKKYAKQQEKYDRQMEKGNMTNASAAQFLSSIFDRNRNAGEQLADELNNES